jgi:hypothetical protein
MNDPRLLLLSPPTSPLFFPSGWRRSLGRAGTIANPTEKLWIGFNTKTQIYVGFFFYLVV